MSFGQAVSSVLSKYATFSGRARRREYWFWILFYVIVMAVAIVLDNLLGTKFSGSYYGWIELVVALALLLPTIAVTVRRLHDTERSGWWYLLNFVCGVGALIVLIFCIIDGTPGPNKYGDSPK